MNKSLISIPVILVGSCLGSAAHAATANSSINVSSTVLSACLVASTDLAFGIYDPTSVSPTDATSSIDVTCTAGTSFTVGLNAGTTGGATVTTRKMALGADRLAYALYSDASRTTNWGNTPGTDTPAATIAGIIPSTFTVYGRVAALQNVPAGIYTDTVTVTVTY